MLSSEKLVFEVLSPAQRVSEFAHLGPDEVLIDEVIHGHDVIEGCAVEDAFVDEGFEDVSVGYDSLGKFTQPSNVFDWSMHFKIIFNLIHNHPVNFPRIKRI